MKTCSPGFLVTCARIVGRVDLMAGNRARGLLE
jgi:hypothetical protein